MKSCSRRAVATSNYMTSSIGLSETSSSIRAKTSHLNCQNLQDRLLTRRHCQPIFDRDDGRLTAGASPGPQRGSPAGVEARLLTSSRSYLSNSLHDREALEN